MVLEQEQRIVDVRTDISLVSGIVIVIFNNKNYNKLQ